MTTTFDISRKDKAEVLAALYNGSQPLGMGILHYEDRDMTVDEARNIIQERQDWAAAQDFPPSSILSFDYLKGRVMKICLDGDELRTSLYNRDNGPDAAEKILKNIPDTPLTDDNRLDKINIMDKVTTPYVRPTLDEIYNLPESKPFRDEYGTQYNELRNEFEIGYDEWLKFTPENSDESVFEKNGLIEKIHVFGMIKTSLNQSIYDLAMGTSKELKREGKFTDNFLADITRGLIFFMQMGILNPAPRA